MEFLPYFFSFFFFNCAKIYFVVAFAFTRAPDVGGDGLAFCYLMLSAFSPRKDFFLLPSHVGIHERERELLRVAYCCGCGSSPPAAAPAPAPAPAPSPSAPPPPAPPPNARPTACPPPPWNTPARGSGTKSPPPHSSCAGSTCPNRNFTSEGVFSTRRSSR